ncbi:thymidylate synthase [Flavobacterium sp. W22_SRS_FK3]|uniref:thymidylate synthase n=1 Tax=Flavobacterium sp. W22_SRS_FK3 TaxID=3240275 RepID=UPI003F91CB56
MKSKLFKTGIDTMIASSFSDFYFDINEYIKQEGNSLNSRIGETYEISNFKTTLTNPLNRCTISQNRNVNIFFHLAESLWVFTGRNDLEFISLFNSKFHQYSDDGQTLHGAYGNRIRNWKSNGFKIDQLLKLTQLLKDSPESRRTVINIWNPELDLQSKSKDIPCNTQLVFKIYEDKLNLTIFNRSNDLHFGYVANIFQFSFMGEIIAFILNKKYNSQTHISNSLHVYTNNNLCNTLIKNNIAKTFYKNYPPSNFSFNFESKSKNEQDKLNELDASFNDSIELLIEFSNLKDIELNVIRSKITKFKKTSSSLYEIVYLLSIYIYYKNKSQLENIDELRNKIIHILYEDNKTINFKHKDFYGLALNYFVTRSSKKFDLFEEEMGSY